MKILIRNLIRNLKWIDVIWSPFTPPKIKIYFGKIKYGTPYFYPRYTIKDPDKPGYLKFKQAKWFKVDIVGLGWKDKWESPRTEWSPHWSLVILNRQLFISFVLDERIWETYLIYKHYLSDNNTSTYDKLKETREKNPNVWISHRDGVEVKSDYFLKSLKHKWYNIFKDDSK